MTEARCIAYRVDGAICHAPAIILDHQYGGMICLEHVSPDVQDAITFLLASGTKEGRVDHDGAVYSWQLKTLGRKEQGHSAWIAGKNASCPFCLARWRDLPKVGEKIHFLSDYHAGETGTVVERHFKVVSEPREVCIELDSDLPDVLRALNFERNLISVNIDRYLIGNGTELIVPPWAPPISLREAADIDDVVITLCDRTNDDHDESPNIQLLYHLISHIWRRRLPLQAEEIWRALEAHGAPFHWKHDVMQRYQYGMEALVNVEGRKPFKNRRVAPFTF
jgi:hypothetical protein